MSRWVWGVHMQPSQTERQTEKADTQAREQAGKHTLPTVQGTSPRATTRKKREIMTRRDAEEEEKKECKDLLQGLPLLLLCRQPSLQIPDLLLQHFDQLQSHTPSRGCA